MTQSFYLDSLDFFLINFTNLTVPHVIAPIPANTNVVMILPFMIPSYLQPFIKEYVAAGYELDILLTSSITLLAKALSFLYLYYFP